jgi:hypothetical protein
LMPSANFSGSNGSYCLSIRIQRRKSTDIWVNMKFF